MNTYSIIVQNVSMIVEAEDEWQAYSQVDDMLGEYAFGWSSPMIEG